MTKYKVTITNAITRYERASVEIDADDDADPEIVAEMAMGTDLEWEARCGDWEGPTYFEVESEDAPTLSWRVE